MHYLLAMEWCAVETVSDSGGFLSESREEADLICTLGAAWTWIVV